MNCRSARAGCNRGLPKAVRGAGVGHKRRQRQRCDRRMIGGGPETVRVLFGLKPGEAFVDGALDFVAKRNIKWRNLQRSWLFSGERIREAANRQRKPDEM